MPPAYRSRKKPTGGSGAQNRSAAKLNITHESTGQRVARWRRRGFRNSSFNIIYGVFLLAPAWVLTQTFFGLFSQASVRAPFWAADEFCFFALGAVLWLLWFIGSFWAMGGPRPLRLYVFGHEMTHAIWVWLWGGRVFETKWWSNEGGYIITDTHNFWIALAPYFYPLYSFVVVLAFGIGGFFWDFTDPALTFLALSPVHWLFLFLGVTWSFHLTFTVWMIPKGQTDLTSHGTFFSLVIIYLMNVLLLSVFLVAAAPELSFHSFLRDLLHHSEDFSETIYESIRPYFPPA